MKPSRRTGNREVPTTATRLLPLLALAAAGQNEQTEDVALDPATFDVRMANVSAPGSVVTSTGSSIDAKFAPGVLVVHEAGFDLFSEGQASAFAGFRRCRTG